MRKIDLESLQFFKSVVDSGSITLAARQLSRVQSNVTTRIKNLEERLGIKLFSRHGNRMTLTADGELLKGYAERLLRLATEAETAMLARTPQGTLKLGTLESTAAARLPPVLSQFHKNYPEVMIELVTGSTSKLLDMVLRYEVDAALISDPFQPQGLDSHPVFSEELVLIAPTTVANALSPDYLRNCTVIAFSTGCSYRRILEEWLISVDVTPNRVLEFASYHAIVACVAAGTGIGIMPKSILKAVFAEPQLQIIPLPSKYANVRTHLVWQKDNYSTVVKAFRNHFSNGL
ncbi:LysR family transcriptional regulator [Limnohabitans sp. 103DPR2]|jgi:DNA-binding transcriptional LysR family regulator|uniref:LysR family transcriptional regulator n=1 Tax=Limnohabitans sp. 103DPR2 TaxID=1678129 RepID=UPI0006DC384A|nr:LysR family transcriptional regulator [Limnohabitans sp. 103DPR2]ALK93007.1 HTH-type transcriptional regulator GltR [Limnohabitans sp. 103DPR2]